MHVPHCFFLLSQAISEITVVVLTFMWKKGSPAAPPVLLSSWWEESYEE